MVAVPVERVGAQGSWIGRDQEGPAARHTSLCLVMPQLWSFAIWAVTLLLAPWGVYWFSDALR